VTDLAAETTARELVQSYFAAEMDGDPSAVIEHFDEDAALVLPDGRSLRGHADIRQHYDEVYSQAVKLDVRLVSTLSSGSRTAVEWEASVLDRAGREEMLRGVNIIRIEADKFAEVRLYFGPSGICELTNPVVAGTSRTHPL
jgi:uncharacterized protein (TIGR02246 family)